MLAQQRECAVVAGAQHQPRLLRGRLVLLRRGIGRRAHQHQFDALASFVFSIGVDRFRSSEVLRRLNAGETQAAAEALAAWIDDGGPLSPPRRRATERALSRSRDALQAFMDAVGESALLVAADGLVRMSGTPQGQAHLRRVNLVFLTEGPRPGVILRQGVLIVVVTPRLGISGRPSSERIAVAAAR
mgnify:CR=1 FL=1